MVETSRSLNEGSPNSFSSVLCLLELVCQESKHSARIGVIRVDVVVEVGSVPCSIGPGRGREVSSDRKVENETIPTRERTEIGVESDDSKTGFVESRVCSVVRDRLLITSKEAVRLTATSLGSRSERGRVSNSPSRRPQVANPPRPKVERDVRSSSWRADPR